MKKICVTEIVLPGGHIIKPDPPIEFEEGEPLPMVLTMGTRFVTYITQMQWCEFEDDPNDNIEIGAWASLVQATRNSGGEG